MNYHDFKKSVGSSAGYLIVPKFLFKDKGMLHMIRHMQRESINIFHTHKAFHSNKEWMKAWSDKDFRSRFNWALCYTEQDYVIGAGCWTEIKAFLKARFPVYHVLFEGRYKLSRVVAVSEPFPVEDFRRYAKVITDDQKLQRPQSGETSG
jgi:hypothetical protein